MRRVVLLVGDIRSELIQTNQLMKPAHPPFSETDLVFLCKCGHLHKKLNTLV
jgi:hypothetical protein